jgi:hypothetical protein
LTWARVFASRHPPTSVDAPVRSVPNKNSAGRLALPTSMPATRTSAALPPCGRRDLAPGRAQLFLSWDENGESRPSGQLGPTAPDDQQVDAEVIQFGGRRMGSQGSINRTHPGCSVKAACWSRR